VSLWQWLDFWLLLPLMNVEFSQLTPEARIWIYAASAALSKEQQVFLLKEGLAFTQTWTAHQQPLNAAFGVFNNVFLVFGVDTGLLDVSGCGIDKSVHLVQEWEKQLGITLFNRLQLEYQLNNEVVITHKQQVIEGYEKGLVINDTLFFNKTVLTAKEFKDRFLIPFKETWVYAQITKQPV
jgi:hypothetical protein